MNKFLCCAISLFVSIGAFANDAGLKAKDFFKAPDTYWMALNPSGEYLASFDNFEGRQVLEIVDPIANHAHEVADFTHSMHKITKFTWLDERNAYFQLGFKRYVLEIKNQAGEVEGILHKLNTSGTLVAPLLDEPQLLFAHRKLEEPTAMETLLGLGPSKVGELFLHKLTVEDLIANNFSAENRFKHEKSGAESYFYDAKSGLLLSGIYDDDESRFFYLQKNQKWREFFTLTDGLKLTVVGFLDDETLAVLSDQNVDKVSLMEFDIKSGKTGKILYQHPKYDLVAASLNPISRGINFVTFIDHGVPQRLYFNSDEKRLHKSLKRSFKNQHVATVGSSVDKNIRLLYVTDSNNPGDYYYYNKAEKAVFYLKPTHKNLSQDNLAKVRPFKFETRDGVELEAILTEPKGEDKNVLLVNPHGGPIGVRDFATYNAENQFFASQGYTVLNVNFRGSAGFGNKFEDLGRGQFGLQIENDISDAVELVKSEKKYDVTCALGTSYGGYSSMMLSINNPDEYDCVVAMFAVFDLPHMFNTSNYGLREERQNALKKVMGENINTLYQQSPFYRAKEISVPVMIVAGGRDKVTPFEQSNRMKYRLRQLEKPVEFLPYPKAGHGHSSWEDDLDMYEQVEYFIWQAYEKKYDSTLETED